MSQVYRPSTVERAALTMHDYRLTPSSIFYFGYLIFEYPAGFILQKLPVARVMAGTSLVWAILMMCTGAAQNFAGLAVCRFLMGM